MSTKELKLEDITIDGGTQSRAKLDSATMEEYAEQMKLGVEFPEAVVFSDGSTNWLAGGFHRYFASKKADCLTLKCDVRKGTLKDARLYAAGSNHDHGLPRSNADKRKAVGMMLEDYADWSDRRIAEHVQVGADLVGQVRNQLSETTVETPSKRTGKDGKTRTVAQKPKPKPPEYAVGVATAPESPAPKPRAARADAPLARAQTDDKGAEVPEALLEVFEDRDTFLQLQRDLNEIAGRVAVLKKRASGACIAAGLAGRLESAAEEIALAAPAVLDGKGKWLSRGAAK